GPFSQDRYFTCLLSQYLLVIRRWIAPAALERIEHDLAAAMILELSSRAPGPDIRQRSAQRNLFIPDYRRALTYRVIRIACRQTLVLFLRDNARCRRDHQYRPENTSEHQLALCEPIVVAPKAAKPPNHFYSWRE